MLSNTVNETKITFPYSFSGMSLLAVEKDSNKIKTDTHYKKTG